MTQYIITRGFGDAVCHLSIGRGCAFCDASAKIVIKFATRRDALQAIKFYAIDGAHVAPAV